jgi:hypothetical protein
MAPLRRRSSTSIPQSVINQASIALDQLPEKPKENLSLKEAVAALKDIITAALERGYSYEEVASMLSEQGVKISASSLKSYLSAIQRTSAAKPARGRGRKSKATAATTTEATPEPTPAATEEAPKRRGGRKPKAAVTEEPAPAPAPAPVEEAPAPRRRGRAKATEPTKTAAKRTTTKAASDAVAKPTSSTRGRRKKTI